MELLAGIGQIASGFRNIPTANGSSSTTGPRQITTGMWNGTVAKYGLVTARRTSAIQRRRRTVASYIMRDTAQTISNATGQAATTLDTYGGYLFGTNNGHESLAKQTPQHH